MCAQRNTVRAETSMPRSASRSRTLAADSRNPKYQRTAVTTTARGQWSRANGVTERSVKVRWQERQRKRCVSRRQPSFFVRSDVQCGQVISPGSYRPT